jgi:ATP-dependent Clp protease adapter protein ClpS
MGLESVLSVLLCYFTTLLNNDNHAYSWLLQETIAAIASISDQQTVMNFFIAIMKKLLQATKEATAPKVKQDGMEVDSTSSEDSATSRR